eukprot:GEMP01045671.1.p1 GENE.GEMP01045671.1~~GEMP01045671.1.p1  ORF type:complete len:316 (-),score=74.39 GEMP01045671.1:739-1686(-)
MELLPVSCSGTRICPEDISEWVASNENVKPALEDVETVHFEMEAQTERSWVLIFAVSSVLLVICTITLFMVVGTLFPSVNTDESGGTRPYRSALSQLYDLAPVNLHSHLERGLTDGVLELDINLLSEEMAAITKRTEEISQLLTTHGDALRELQAAPSDAKCSTEDDWAPGGAIDEGHTSLPVGRKPGQWLPWLVQPALWAPHGPEVTLAVGPIQRGHCFAFAVPGQIQLSLPHSVPLFGWGVTALMSESQPQRIRAIALPSGDDLGTLDFDRKSPKRMQTVQLANGVQTQTVRFLIDSSFGASFCCLYRLHVFG